MNNVIQFHGKTRESWVKRTMMFFVVDSRKDMRGFGSFFFLAGLLLGLWVGWKSEENVILSLIASLISAVIWGLIFGYVGMMIDKIILTVYRKIKRPTRP